MNKNKITIIGATLLATMLTVSCATTSQANGNYPEVMLQQVKKADMPSNAKTGECFARVFSPPVYSTSTARVLVEQESTDFKIIPATYKWVEKKVLVEPTSIREVPVPVKYKFVEEKVLVKPAHTIWKKGKNPVGKKPAGFSTSSTSRKPIGKNPDGTIKYAPLDVATGEIMCRVRVPAEYKIVRKRVVDQPATIRKDSIPAVYKTVRVKQVDRPLKKEVIKIPAKYKTITKTVTTSDGDLRWSRVLCETNVTSSAIMKIQRALKSAGNDPGSIDGKLNYQTKAALDKYQRRKGLATGGLTYETIRSLNVSL